MDRLQARATKAVNDFLKEKRKRKDSRVLREFQDMTKGSDTYSSVLDNGAYNCRYCSKAFTHPKYVMHHMLRRHSETLLKFHDDFLKVEQAKWGHTDQPTVSKPVTSSLEDQVKELKQVLQILKNEVFQQLPIHRQQAIKEVPSYSNDVEDKNESHRQRKLQNSERSVSRELAQLKDSCKSSEEAIINLEKKYNNITETIHQNIAYQETIRKHSNDYQKFSKELGLFKTEIALLKDKLEHQVNNLKTSQSHDLQKQLLKSDEKFKRLDEKYSSEFRKLNVLIDSRLKEICYSHNEDIEQKFEQHLQNYLEQLSFRPNKISSHKKTVPTTIYKDSVIKKKHPAKPTVNIQTVNTTSTLKDQSIPTNLPKDVVSSPKRTNRLKKPRPIDEIRAKVERRLNSKMQLLGIVSGQSKLSSSEVKSKIKALKYETRQLQAKYYNFHNTRKILEEQVENQTQLLILKTVPKRKITFASPESTIHNPVFKKTSNKNNSYQMDSSIKPKVLGSAEFIVSASESETSSEIAPKMWFPQMKDKGESSENTDDVSSISHISHTTDSIVDAIDGSFKKTNLPLDTMTSHRIQSFLSRPLQSIEPNACDDSIKISQSQRLFAAKKVDENSPLFTSLLKSSVTDLDKHSSLEELDSWDIDDDSSDVEKPMSAK